jgi:hypothetical protein
MAAEMRGERLQGMQRFFDDEQGRGENFVRQRRYAGQGNDGGDGSAIEGAGDEVVAVEALSADSEEELTWGDGARVDGVAKCRERADSRGAGWGFQLGAAIQGGLG